VHTSLAPAELAVASELLLIQVPKGFDLASLAGLRLKLAAQPAGADGVVCSAQLPDGSTFQLVQESAGLAAQLRVVATPGSGGAALRHAQRSRRRLPPRACLSPRSAAMPVTRRLTATVRPAAAAGEGAAPAAAAGEAEPSPLPSDKAGKKKRREREEAEEAKAAPEDAPAAKEKKRKAKK